MTFILRKEIRRRFHSAADRDRFAACLDLHLARADREYSEGWRVVCIGDALPEYLKYLDAERRVSEGRIADSRRVLMRFARDLGEHLDNITREGLRAWRIERMRVDGVQESTVNKDVKILQAFARWAIRDRLWTIDAEAVAWLAIEKLPCRRPTPTVLTERDLVESLRPYPWHVRLPILAIFELGDRPGAIYALRGRDIWMPRLQLSGVVRLQKRKGRAGDRCERSVSFDAGGRVDMLLGRARALFASIVGRPPRKADPIFVNARGNSWTNSTMAGALQHHRRRRKKGRKLTPYIARHSLATMIARMDGNPTHVQLVLGHAKRSTGEIYTHLTGSDSEAARDAIDRIRGGAVDRMLRAQGG